MGELRGASPPPIDISVRTGLSLTGSGCFRLPAGRRKVCDFRLDRDPRRSHPGCAGGAANPVRWSAAKSGRVNFGESARPVAVVYNLASAGGWNLPAPKSDPAVRFILKLVVVLAVIYALAVGLFFAAMHKPPEKFAGIVAKMPPVFFPVLPFRQMWTVARRGQLEPGGRAPEFELSTHDKQSAVRLSELNRGRPVVLVFGSYT